VAAVIYVDAIWLATEPLGMPAATETALSRVVAVSAVARPHHAYCFANRRANRMKVLAYDGIGVWLAPRLLNRGKFVWADALRRSSGSGRESRAPRKSIAQS